MGRIQEDGVSPLGIIIGINTTEFLIKNFREHLDTLRGDIPLDEPLMETTILLCGIDRSGRIIGD